jgi:hypothetical protein
MDSQDYQFEHANHEDRSPNHSFQQRYQDTDYDGIRDSNLEILLNNFEQPYRDYVDFPVIENHDQQRRTSLPNFNGETSKDQSRKHSAYQNQNDRSDISGIDSKSFYVEQEKESEENVDLLPLKSAKVLFPQLKESFMSTYILYRIDFVWNDQPLSVYRKFADFKELRRAIQTYLPFTFLYPMHRPNLFVS